MCLKLTIFIAFLGIYHINGALLLWSKHKFEIPALRSFGDENFQELIQDLGYPEVTVYKSSSLIPELKQILNGYYTVYSPNGEINTENATEISGDDLSLLEIKQKLDSSQDNILSVMVMSNGRYKRELKKEETSDLNEPVFYKGLLQKGNVYGLLYSSQPLLLKMNNNDTFLGNTRPDMITMDIMEKDKIVKLSIKIPQEGSSVIIILRFVYVWTNYYWSLTGVTISDNHNTYLYNLTIEQDVTAPAHFSYHCSGTTVFSSSENGTVLKIYDLQTQIDSINGKFSDAYDCVDFTTGPIWSGLFVTAILGIGLIIALIAINDIKTMDKFDNQKTKQLVITVTE